MKIHFLVAVLVLFSKGRLLAQSNLAEPTTSKSRPTSVSNPDADPEAILLPPGTLREVVNYISQTLMLTWQDHVGDMPNIVLAKDTEDCELSGTLTLHRVSPLQAVALAAAAADCTMEAIVGPAESTDTPKAPVIIGYRITRNKTSKAGSGNVAIPHGDSALATAPPAKSGEDPKQTFVRVYSLGAALGMKTTGEQNKSEAKRQADEELASNEKDLLALVTDALDKADPVSPQPQITVHPESRALVVKATAAQHEIVQQVVQALKENGESQARIAITAKH